MTAFARFSMAVRSMRDATNLAGSQGRSALLRRQDIIQPAQRLGLRILLLTLNHFAYHRLQRCSLIFLRCIYSCNRLFQSSHTANPALST